MKKLLFVLLAIITLSSCADSKVFKKSDGTTFIAEPYGWANADARKIDGVVYECCLGNVVWGLIGVETLVVPVWISGWELFEPVRYEEPKY